MPDSGEANSRRRLARSLGTNPEAEFAAWKAVLEVRPNDQKALARLANLLVAGGRRAEAAIYLRRMAEADPTDDRGWRRLARLHSRMGDVDGEIAALQDLLDSVGPDEASSERLLRLFRDSGRSLEAAAHLKLLVERDPADANGWRRLARLYNQMDDVEGEIDTLTGLLQSSGEDAAARLELAQLLADNGRTAEAAAHLQVAASANPSDAEGWRRLARLHAQAGDREGEIATLTSLLQFCGEDAATRLRLVQLLSALGRGADAAVQMRALAEARPTDGEGWRWLARLHAKFGDVEGEIAALRDRLRLAGPDAVASDRLMRLLIESGRGDEAAAHQQSIAEANPTDAEGWRRLARLYGQIGDADGEIRALRDGLRLAGLDADAEDRLLRLLIDRGRNAEVAARLRALAEANPTSSEGWRRLARHCAHTAETDGEIAALRSLLRADPDDAQSRMRLARLLSDSGRTSEAGTHLRVLAEADPTDPEGWRRLVRVYERAEDTEGEAAALTDLLAHAGEDPASRMRLEQLRSLQGAFAGFDHSAAAHENNPDALLALAEACHKAGSYDQAYALYARCVALSPSDPNALGRFSQFLFEQADRNARIAAKVMPDSHRFALSLGMIMAGAGQPEELPTASNDASEDQSRRRLLGVWPPRRRQFDDFEALVRRYVLTGIPAVPVITPEARVVTMGSCFALHVAEGLQARGCNVFHRRVNEEMNSTFANRYLVDWALGGDDNPISQQLSSTGELARQELRAALESCDVFVFSAGVSPAHFRDGEFVMTKGAGKAGTEFRMTTVEENVENLRVMIARLRQARPQLQVFLTVSPVPLGGTFERASAVLADCVSKSTLRMAVEQVLADGDPGVRYWPSFEIVRWLGAHLTTSPPAFGVDDERSRHVSTWLVDMVIKLFVERFGSGLSLGGLDQPGAPTAVAAP